MMIFPRYVFEQVNKKILVHSLIDIVLFPQKIVTKLWKIWVRIRNTGFCTVRYQEQ
jgi:hypothetical protein